MVSVNCDPKAAIEAYQRKKPLRILSEGQEYVCMGDRYGLGVMQTTEGYTYVSVASRQKDNVNMALETFLGLDGVEETDIPSSYLEKEWKRTLETDKIYAPVLRPVVSELMKDLGI